MRTAHSTARSTFTVDAEPACPPSAAAASCRVVTRLPIGSRSATRWWSPPGVLPAVHAPIFGSVTLIESYTPAGLLIMARGVLATGAVLLGGPRFTWIVGVLAFTVRVASLSRTHMKASLRGRVSGSVASWPL